MRFDRLTRRYFLASVAGAAMGFGAMSATAQEVMAPLADGFPDRPIVLLVVDEPGSTDSVFASQIAEAASKYSPQPVTVEHRIDFTNFGTWEALAWVQDQGEMASNGYINYVYTLPDATIDLLAIDIETQVGVGLDDLVGVIGAERVPIIMIQRSDAPWGDTL